MRQVQREFEIALTPLELAAISRRGAEKLAASDAAEQQRLSRVADATDLRKQVKGLSAEALEIARGVLSGTERRPVKCEWRPHPNRPVMQLHRLDMPDGADPKVRIVEERAMDEAETRGEFDEPEKPATNGDGNGHGDGHAAPKSGAVRCPAPALAEELDGERCGGAGVRNLNGFCEAHASVYTKQERMKIAREWRKKAKEAAREDEAPVDVHGGEEHLGDDLGA